MDFLKLLMQHVKLCNSLYAEHLSTHLKAWGWFLSFLPLFIFCSGSRATLNSAPTSMPTTVVVIISLLQYRRHFKWGGMPVNPELWKNKALFSCRERSLRDSMRASHRRAQLLDLRREWMERTGARAKPQRQTPNSASEHQTCGCQLGTQMDAVFLLPPWGHSCSAVEPKPYCGTTWTPAKGRQTNLHKQSKERLFFIVAPWITNSFLGLL